MIERDHLVIGNGFASTLRVADLLRRNKSVIWIAGSGVHLTPPLPQLKSSEAVSWLNELCSFYEIDLGPFSLGNFLRVPKTKGYKEAVMDETLLPSENQLVFTGEEGRFSQLSPMEIEDELREKCLKNSQLIRLESVQILELKKSDDGLICVLSDLREFFGKEASLLDLPKYLPKIETCLDFSHPSLLNQPDVSALQLRFLHDDAQASQLGRSDSFWFNLTKEQEDQFPKNVFGFFTRSGKQSLWTILLNSDEVLDNALLTKRVRRLKNLLSRAFSEANVQDSFLNIQFKVEENVLMNKTASVLQLKENKLNEYLNSKFFIYSDCRGISQALDLVFARSIAENKAMKNEIVSSEFVSQVSSHTI